MGFQPDGGGGFLYLPYRCRGDWRIARIDEHGNTNNLGHQLTQEPQSLGHYLIRKKINASRVAARPSEAGDKFELDRVFADTEDNRDRRGRSFGRERD